MNSEMRTRIPLNKPRRRVMLALGWYAGQIHHGVARFARDAGWILNLDAVRSGGAPQGWRGDGIIAILGSNRRMDKQLFAKHVPMVNIGHGGPSTVPSVRTDDDAIARLAVEHFTSRGFRNYAFYLSSGGPGEMARYRAFARELAEQQLTLLPIDWAAQRSDQNDTRETVRLRWVTRAIEAMPKPLAVFAEFDDRAIEILHACEMARIPVPEQVAVLGVDNDELRCECAPVPLSSIDDDQEQQGYAAAAMLDRIMRGEAPAEEPLLIPPREITTRRSSDILAVEHPIVAGALRAIWQHYQEPILAEDIAEMFPISSRRLHDAFCKHIGHSIADELARKRCERVKELLIENDHKLTVIARMTGFSSPDHLTKVFNRVVGTTPSKYRHRVGVTARTE
jgi:LacI family transcriptional regulator